MLAALLLLWTRTITAVSSRGGRYGFVHKDRQDVYRALRRQGKSKSVAAAIANEGHTSAGRRSMSRKASATRRRGGKRR